jgi:DNA-binding CsgD family transcriptional regulator
MRLEAAMGLEEACRATVRDALALALPAGGFTIKVHAEAALGLLELGLGRATRAVEHLDTADRLSAEYGLRDPAVVPFGPDRIEALLRADAPDLAHAALAGFQAMAERTQRPWPLACVARCRGMLEGDFDAWFARAYAHHGTDASPFELGRTELCHGERLRRARRVREARERLRAALERFEGIGAAPWAARARAELRAAGGAASQARMPATRELTPQELEVALAVARGATNREVAAALYVSPKTVEVHLSRVFRKLGVRSRTELATHIAGTK